MPGEIYEVVKRLIGGSSLPGTKLLSPPKSVNSVPGCRVCRAAACPGVRKIVTSASALWRLACATPKSLWSISTEAVW